MIYCYVAEEGGNGKDALLAKGAYDEMDICLMQVVLWTYAYGLPDLNLLKVSSCPGATLICELKQLTCPSAHRCRVFRSYVRPVTFSVAVATSCRVLVRMRLCPHGKGKMPSTQQSLRTPTYLFSASRSNLLTGSMGSSMGRTGLQIVRTQPAFCRLPPALLAAFSFIFFFSYSRLRQDVVRPIFFCCVDKHLYLMVFSAAGSCGDLHSLKQRRRINEFILVSSKLSISSFSRSYPQELTDTNQCSSSGDRVQGKC
jgi:hypothetical protein